MVQLFLDIAFPLYSIRKAQLLLKVVRAHKKLLFVLYPGDACGGATKQRETFPLPSNLFAGRGGR